MAPRMAPSETNLPPRPFLKWAGGKAQLLSQFMPLYPRPDKMRRYIEPFVGSGAVFFHVWNLFRPRKVILADNNEDLMNVYSAIRDDVDGVIRCLARHKAAHSYDYYYRVRAQKDRKSTRLNSSHGYISYAVFCLKKKKNKNHKI